MAHGRLFVRVAERVDDLDDDTDEVALVRRQRAQDVQAPRDEALRQHVLRDHVTYTQVSLSLATDFGHLRTSWNIFRRPISSA